MRPGTMVFQQLSRCSCERFLAACSQEPPKMKFGCILLGCYTNQGRCNNCKAYPDAKMIGIDKVCTALFEFSVLFGRCAQLRAESRAGSKKDGKKNIQWTAKWEANPLCRTSKLNHEQDWKVKYERDCVSAFGPTKPTQNWRGKWRPP